MTGNVIYCVRNLNVPKNDRTTFLGFVKITFYKVTFNAVLVAKRAEDAEHTKGTIHVMNVIVSTGTGVRINVDDGLNLELMGERGVPFLTESSVRTYYNCSDDSVVGIPSFSIALIIALMWASYGIEAIDKWCKDPLKPDRPDIVFGLRQLGCVIDYYEWPAATECIKTNKPKTLDLLLRIGSKLDDHLDHLMIAYTEKHQACAKVLLNRGVKLRIESRDVVVPYWGSEFLAVREHIRRASIALYQVLRLKNAPRDICKLIAQSVWVNRQMDDHFNFESIWYWTEFCQIVKGTDKPKKSKSSRCVMQ